MRKPTLPFVVSAIFFIAVLCTTPLFAAEIIIDDFNDGSQNQNSLGGFTGAFSDGATTAFCTESLLDGGMALTFSRENQGESFAGFFSQLGAGNGTVNLVSAGINQISFKVRGDLANSVPGGHHNFTIEVKDDLGHVLQTPLTNVPGLEVGTVQGEFRQVDVPLAAMFPHAGQIDLTRIREVVMAFNQEFTDATAAGTSSRVLIDDLKFTTRVDPPENVLDHNSANPDLDFIAGNNDFDINLFVGPSNRHVVTVAEDAKSLRGSALKMYHDLSDSGDFFNFIAFVPTHPINIAAEGIRTVKFRARKTGFNSGPTRAVLEIKKGGVVRGTVLTYAIGQPGNETEYAETIFPIYSESDTIEEITLVFFDGGEGAFLVDEVSLSQDPYVPQNPPYVPSAGPARSDDELLDYIQSQSARYFIDQVIGDSFHAKDRSAADSASSIAATGFELSTLTIISERYSPNPGHPWHIVSSSGVPITPEEAQSRVRTILDEFLAIQAAQPDIQTGAGDPDRKYGIAGFFYHFLNEDGTRAHDSEVSVIDTAIFLTAAIQAGEYFGGDIRTKAEALLDHVNWNYVFYDPDKAFRLSWLPQAKRGFTVPDPNGIGFLSDGTIGRPTDELMLVNTLALASDPSNIAYQQALYSYPRVERAYHSRNGETIPVVNSFFGSAFTYLYAHLFFDFETLGTDRPDLISAPLRNPVPVNWWTNSVNGFRANRQLAVDRSEFFPFSFHENSWGISAVERPDTRYEGLYGGSPAENGPTHDGTVAPHISFSALPFFRTSAFELPGSNISFQAMRFAYDHFYNDLFGAYGPVDSYNDRAEFSEHYLGLDQGPIVLSIENYRSRLMWDTFMKNSRIKAACAVGFGHAPEIAAVQDKVVTAGNLLTFNVTATDVDGDSGIEIFSDNLPSGATLLNNGAGIAAFSWTPTVSDVGNRIVQLFVRDVYRTNPEPVFLTIRVEVPNSAPHAFIRLPAAGTILTGMVHIEAATNDPANIRLGILYIDGRRIFWNYGGEVAYDLQTAFFQNGSHTVKARFYHNVLQKYLEVEQIFTFQNPTVIPRAIDIIQPLENARLTGTVAVIVGANDPQQTMLYQVFVDRTYVAGSSSTNPSGPFYIKTPRYADGWHTLKVTAYNSFSAAYLTDQIQVLFDNNQAAIKIISPPHNSTVSGIIKIETLSGLPKLSYGRLYVDGIYTARDSTAPFSFTVDTRRFTNGPHPFRVTALAIATRETVEHQITLNVQN